MSADTLTFDMSQMAEGSPQIFVKKDWLNLQDQNNGNYGSNQLVLDTSQLANSNKYMDYRNAYLSVPLVMAVSSTVVSDGATPPAFQSMISASDATVDSYLPGAQQCLSLKNWFGSIIHSMLLDYAGTTIIQQTPLTSLWSVFTLTTSLSMGDVETLGPTIGFYPDDVNFARTATGSKSGVGTQNNRKTVAQGRLGGAQSESEFSNAGIWARWSKLIANPFTTSVGAIAGQASSAGAAQIGQFFGDIQNEASMKALYRSYLIQQTSTVVSGTTYLSLVYQIQAAIYLRHIHSFFSQVPLLKGVFFRLTLNLNQPVVELSTEGGQDVLTCSSITSPLGGIVPIMVASQEDTLKSSASTTVIGDPSCLNLAPDMSARVTLNVGNKIVDPTQNSRCGSKTTSLNQSVFLYVPSFTFNPSFEQAYLSKPTKTIVYSDLYQYTTSLVTAGSAFNFLITNGISNIRSVLLLPMEASMKGGPAGSQPYWSPFDSCGGGTVAPMAAINNFNVVVAGQNMIYNTQQYGFEQFQNQLYGVNQVNAGLTDGLTSGLIDFWKFQQMYGYYYVNCSRMLPVDEAVPKSVSIQGTNQTLLDMKYIVFIEYGVQVNVDVLTGARV